MSALTVIPNSPVTPPAMSISDVERIALAIAKGGLFGARDPNAVLTLCLLAQAEGQHPAVVMRDYDLIQGKPAKKAEAMLRDFIFSGGKVEWHELSNERAAATFSHPGGGAVTIDWDMERAKVAGLGGKDMWKKFPRQMLRSRTISEGVRTVFPGATSGLYVPEELADMPVAAPVAPPPPTPAAKRARDIKAERQALPEPEQTEEVHASAADDPRAKAFQWLSEFSASVSEAPDIDALATIQTDAAKALAKLRANHPDLADMADAAIQRRLSAFEAVDADGVVA